MTELPALERALLDAARRRHERPWWRPLPVAARRLASGVALTAAVAAVVLAVLAVTDGSGPAGTDERPASPPAERWTTTADERRGFEVSVPSGWQLAAATLTPNLGDPHELLSAGTFPLRFRAGACNHVPTGALETMGRTDGFVTVQERGRAPRSQRAGFPPRPERFAARASPHRGDVSGCLPDARGLVEFWLPFSDAGRHFYAMVVLGGDAPASVRAEAFAVLDRLRFDPAAKPGWKSSP